jgi:hypothetical protein
MECIEDKLVTWKDYKYHCKKKFPLASLISQPAPVPAHTAPVAVTTLTPHPTSYLLPPLAPLNPLLFVYPRRCCRPAIWPVPWLREVISKEVVLTAVGEMTGEGGGGGGGRGGGGGDVAV